MSEVLSDNSAALKDLKDLVVSQIADKVLETQYLYGELTIAVKRDAILKVLTFLRDDAGCLFKQLVDICGVDYPERAERFDVVYHMLSLKHNLRVRVKVSTDEETPVPSAVSVYSAANWFERETWDLFGIFFDNHPDPRRILPIGLGLLAVGYISADLFHPFWMVMVSFLIVGIGAALAVPSANALGSLSVGRSEQAGAAALLASAPPAGFVVGPLLGSVLYMTNPSLPFMASAAVFCIRSVYAVLVTGRRPLSPG